MVNISTTSAINIIIALRLLIFGYIWRFNRIEFMQNRGAFSNRLGFILAAAGSAVGLGNIWRFPFEAEAGGGAAFVIM